jgi:hypothetical protein
MMNETIVLYFFLSIFGFPFIPHRLFLFVLNSKKQLENVLLELAVFCAPGKTKNQVVVPPATAGAAAGPKTR